MTMDDPTGPALFTDLYELTMLRAYWASGMEDEATFSLFVRALPPGRGHLLACGLDDALAAIERLAFTPADCRWLAEQGFPAPFLKRLGRLRFSGRVRAVPEGTPVFPDEPILEVTAPIGEAQLLETLLVNQIGLQTLLATKAVRVVRAARGRPVVDFGGRRAQGIDAAVKGARAFAVAGVSATSNALAGRRYGLRVAGIVAHSFVEACPSEREAFRRFAAVFPEATLLVDTYDTLDAVRAVAALAHGIGPSFRPTGVRLDSGDLLRLSRGARRILDEAGLSEIRIFASGGLDEREVDRLVRAGAPIDSFGVGTDMSVSGDAPALDIAYKLVSYAGSGRMKLSEGKRTLPGSKQVFREMSGGRAVRDVIARADETRPGRALLEPVMERGRRLPAAMRAVDEIRRFAAARQEELPERLLALDPGPPPYPVSLSPYLAEDERRLRERLTSQVSASASSAMAR